MKSGLKTAEIAQLNNNPTPRAILLAGQQRGDGVVWEVKLCLALRFRARSVKVVQWRRKRQLRERKGRVRKPELQLRRGEGCRHQTLSSKFSLQRCRKWMASTFFYVKSMFRHGLFSVMFICGY